MATRCCRLAWGRALGIGIGFLFLVGGLSFFGCGGRPVADLADVRLLEGDPAVGGGYVRVQVVVAYFESDVRPLESTPVVVESEQVSFCPVAANASCRVDPSGDAGRRELSWGTCSSDVAPPISGYTNLRCVTVAYLVPAAGLPYDFRLTWSQIRDDARGEEDAEPVSVTVRFEERSP